MKFDPNSTINQGRWRLKDPNDFERMWTVKTKIPGVTYIAGYLKENHKFGVQAIRFDKKLWTEKKQQNGGMKEKINISRLGKIPIGKIKKKLTEEKHYILLKNWWKN